MAAFYTVGGTLPNGNTVVSDSYSTTGNVATETIVDSAGNSFVITDQIAGSLPANRAVVAQNVVANLATLQAWITANPSGAVLSAAQTLVLAKMLVALTYFALNDFVATTGT